MELWLARAARTQGDRVALEGSGTRLDYQALFDRARAAAGALLERGVGAGDRVALALAGQELVVALHGCLAIGAVAVTEIGRCVRGKPGQMRFSGKPLPASGWDPFGA